MTRKGLRCTGTICQNRTQNCPLTLPAVIKKNERGVFETYCDGEVVLCQWNDNKPVCIVSNFESTEPTNTVRRWSAAKKSKINITQPRMVESYNKYMGGVDLFHRFLSEYRPRLRSKKWWWCLFANFLNMSVVAAWRLHKEIGGTMNHLQFRREIVRTLLGRVPDKSCRPGPSGMPVDSIRFSGSVHICVSAGKQERCKLCKKNTMTMCNRCEVLLHKKCSVIFHDKHV